MSVFRTEPRRDWTNEKKSRVGIVVLVLALVAAAFAWPLISSSDLAFVDTEQLAINDLKRLRSGDPVELTGIVTFVDPAAHAFHLQDVLSGIRIEMDGKLPQAGERVSLRGYIDREYDSSVGLRSVTFANIEIIEHRRGSLPAAQVIAIPDLLRGNQAIEGRRVQTGGVVRLARLDGDRLTLELGDAGQRMAVTVLNARGVAADSLLDARVTVRGALQLGLDRMAETFAPHLWVISPEDLVATSAAPSSRHTVSAHELYAQARWLAEGHRVAVHGTVIRSEADGTLLLDSAGLLLPVKAEHLNEFRTGENVRASGWPTRQRWNVVLEHATVARVSGAEQGKLDIAIQPELTKIEQIRALDRHTAARSLPVQITGVLTSVHYVHQFAFVQSGDAAIWMDAWGQSLDAFEPGQLVEITGVTAPGEFAPVIAQPRLKLVSRGSMPTAQLVDPEIAPSGAYDSEWVEIEGLVRPFSSMNGFMHFSLDTPIGSVGGILITPAEASLLEHYVDARVRVRGVLGTSFTTKGVLTGYRLFVHSLRDMQVLAAAPKTQDLTTPRPINQLLRFKADASANRRVLVRGVVTLRAPGLLFMEDPSGTLQVQVGNTEARVGDVVEAIGYPSPSNRGPVLADASVRLLGFRKDLQPGEATAEQAMSGSLDNRLVSIEARLVSQGESAAQQTLTLQSGHIIFNAELEGSVPFRKLREGSIVRVTGICSVQRQQRSDRYSGESNAAIDSFRILLRSPGDVAVLHAVPWWNVRHAWPVIALLTLSIAAAMLWARTLRRRVEEQTAQIEGQSTFLRQVIDICPDFISVKDHSGRYALVNRALAGEYSQSPDELIGKTERDLGLFAAEVSAIEASDREVLDSGREKTIAEHARVDQSGRVVWLHTVKRPILDAAGRATHLLEVSNDITTHKDAETILEGARAAAQSANRAKSEFLANMSHEIRTPLNGIIGMSELCLDTDLSREQREYVQALKVSGDGLLGVINDILDFSKIEAGKLELESRPFEIREAVESVVKTLALQAHRQGVELVCEIAPTIPHVLIGDATRLRQVLHNLIGEAIKGTARGEVLVSVTLLAQDEARSMLQLTIADTSTRAAVEQLDDPFRLSIEQSGSTSKQLSGADLGLTISTRLVELMEGRVWAEADEHGRRLHFTVRLSTSAKQPKAPTQVAPLLLRGARVMIVDDNASQRRVLGEWLSRAGMRPIAAGSSSEGLERVRECANAGDPCTVAVVDYDMPIAGGTTFVQYLRERRIGIPVLMMVGTTAQRDIAIRCQTVDVDAFVVKPLSEEALRTALGRMLEERESLSGGAPTETAAAAPGQALSVLVAEDNAVNQMVMQRLLHKRGHRVVIASSGKAALAAVDAQRFDLILMDVQMPELDGLEATREIRRRETASGKRVPIVALTAHAMSGDRERCLTAGMDGYMTKPVNPSELDETLARYAVGRMPPP